MATTIQPCSMPALASPHRGISRRFAAENAIFINEYGQVVAVTSPDTSRTSPRPARNVHRGARGATPGLRPYPPARLLLDADGVSQIRLGACTSRPRGSPA